ncbi:hypothetical protein [Candidatus Pelagisphaera phototrophica]|uniref:hypothetical protein n=1 Tax=Candidatus Pelagisphaera phototrophica TaxID=2684113 RepID=UPI0019F6FE80|nr:hypothetical protein [Candidatus Pelagisphaera phototrophica]QXD31308.1 hypothetical protein GA004_13355 [Candidatus Pelagisphaera phototrophica]
MQPKDKQRLLRKWEKQRSALQSKIDAILAEKHSNDPAIQRFSIDWDNAGINLYSSGCESAPPHRKKKLIDEAAKMCQPEITELAVLVDRSIKEQEALYQSLIRKPPPPKWPECFIEANRSLAGMRN